MSRPEETLEATDAEQDLLDELDDGDEGFRERLESFIPDLVKRGLVAGMGAAMATEEGLRKITKEMSLPKDVANYLASTASSTKDELLRIMAREIREFLQTVNLSEEIAKMLTTLSFEVKTEIRFIPNDERLGGVSPDVKAKVSLKKVDKQPATRKRRIRRRLRKKKTEDD